MSSTHLTASTPTIIGIIRKLEGFTPERFNAEIAEILGIQDPYLRTVTGLFLQKALSEAQPITWPTTKDEAKQFALEYARHWEEYAKNGLVKDIAAFTQNDATIPKKHLFNVFVGLNRLWSHRILPDVEERLSTPYFYALCSKEFISYCQKTAGLRINGITIPSLITIHDTLQSHFSQEGSAWLSKASKTPWKDLSALFPIPVQLAVAKKLFSIGENTALAPKLRMNRLHRKTKDTKPELTPISVLLAADTGSLPNAEQGLATANKQFLSFTDTIPSPSREFALKFWREIEQKILDSVGKKNSDPEKEAQRQAEIGGKISTKINTKASLLASIYIKVLKNKASPDGTEFQTLIAIRDTMLEMVLTGSASLSDLAKCKLQISDSSAKTIVLAKSIENLFKSSDLEANINLSTEARALLQLFRIWEATLTKVAEILLREKTLEHTLSIALFAQLNGKPISPAAIDESPQTKFFEYLAVSLGIPPDALFKLTMEQVRLIEKDAPETRESFKGDDVLRIEIDFGENRILVFNRSALPGSDEEKGFKIIRALFAERKPPSGKYLFRKDDGSPLAEIYRGVPVLAGQLPQAAEPAPAT